MFVQKTLLVIEDDSVYADLISIIMEGAGYAVRVARTMRDALCLMDDQVTAVTLDLHLPDSKGMDSLLAFRKRWKDVPILILSGFISEHEFHDLVSLGADACIQKPPRPDTLPMEIARAIKMRDYCGSIDELQRCHRALCTA